MVKHWWGVELVMWSISVSCARPGARGTVRTECCCSDAAAGCVPSTPAAAGTVPPGAAAPGRSAVWRLVWVSCYGRATKKHVMIIALYVCMFVWQTTSTGGPPDVKWSPLPIDICNTRGLADALPSQKQTKEKLSHVPVTTPAPIPFKPEHSNAALRQK